MSTAYLCRFPNGVVSIVNAESEDEALTELSQDRVCTLEELEGGAPIIMEMPKGFRVHVYLDDAGDFRFCGWTLDAMPTIRRLFPTLTALYEVGFKTKRAGRIAQAKAAAIECGKAEAE